MDTHNKKDKTREPQRQEHPDLQPTELHGEAMAAKKAEQHEVQTELRENAAVKDIGAASIRQTLPQAQGQRRSDRSGKK